MCRLTAFFIGVPIYFMTPFTAEKDISGHAGFFRHISHGHPRKFRIFQFISRRMDGCSARERSYSMIERGADLKVRYEVVSSLIECIPPSSRVQQEIPQCVRVG